MIDSTVVHIHAYWRRTHLRAIGTGVGSKASPSAKIHVACCALGYPLGLILTGANVSDRDQCRFLLAAYLQPGTHVIMDKGYDSDAIRAYVNQQAALPS